MKQPSTNCIFSEVSSEYATYRASYSKFAIDKILEGLDNPSQLVTVDIGAGTGIGSRQLAERGLKVIAIEPDSAMIQVATPHPLIEFQEGTAEVTQLPDKTADLVTCFTAFHWFDFEQSLREFQRILKPSGRLALVWNHWDTSDPFIALSEVFHMLKSAGTLFHPPIMLQVLKQVVRGETGEIV